MSACFNPGARFRRMNRKLGCDPLAWLLSDPDLLKKESLIGLLGSDPNFPASKARDEHILPADAQTWPMFNASTQGDFASYLLSGIGRLCRILGHKGLLIIIDEMEKWQDLNWKEQSRAGNLLGGLIWGASAAEGHRGKSDEPELLCHSRRCGGYPFTTTERCHVGVATALTPRGDEGPEADWSEYGLLEIVDLPTLTEARLIEYCRKVAPLYAIAYALKPPSSRQLEAIAINAVTVWIQQGDFTTRLGVQSVIGALNAWREAS